MEDVDMEQSDALYKPFPSFDEWSKCYIDANRWERNVEIINEVRLASPEQLQQAQEIVKKVAAVETGVLENLYEGDRGFTFSAAAGVSVWQAALSQKQEQVRSLIKSQLEAYDYVLDFATQQQRIVQAWIRDLHAVICGSQETFKVLTPLGWQEQALPKGQYKDQANHVATSDGAIHAYAPVSSTPFEMARFCDELATEQFRNAHPILQASYAHYAFVVVHPFADGNGRVARALASVFTYRSLSIPLLIVEDNKREYFAALETADNGNYQIFVNFIFERVVDAIRLIKESIKTASLPSADATITSVTALFVTRGGYQHEDMDRAGYKFFDLLEQEVKSQLSELTNGTSISFQVSRTGGTGDNPINDQFRWPILDGKRNLIITMSVSAPANKGIVDTNQQFVLAIPRNAGLEDDILIYSIPNNDIVEARVTELLPTPTFALEMRLRVIVQRIVAELSNQLRQRVEQAIKHIGY